MATARKTAPAKAPAGKAQAAKSPSRRPAAKAAVAAPKAAAPVAAAKTPKPEKPKKPKLVRDSFTIPKTEYLVLEQLKQRAGKLGTPAKKSEVLRAGVKALAAMADADFRAALGSVPAIKTGRPAKASA